MNVKITNGETIHYQKRVSGENILLLIHGNFASSDHWDILMEQLPKEYTIYAIDLRGYGKSTYHTPIDSFNDFAEDIRLFCDVLHIQKCHVMGWSNGGGVAMQFAANYPTRVKSIILLNSISTKGYPALNSNGERMTTREEISADPMINRMLQAQKNKEKSFFEAALLQLMFVIKKPAESRFKKYIEAALNQRNIIDVANAANQFNISGGLKNITSPILILWGRHDLMVPEKMTLELVNEMKENSVSFIYKQLNTGHAPLVDDIDSIISELDSFLDITS
ncbi:alpha/beta fold hydrolase [Oceanobacillus sp. 1P07AA]|uniref:intracellular short-chain-length polyhydroxyalkanoate depolymerase n=1 Tax=Oceanobacillus sp. 1P07AA TaxID=3132293 RepID=UPI0039A61287